jgi:hypothetical protein
MSGIKTKDIQDKLPELVYAPSHKGVGLVVSSVSEKWIDVVVIG